MRSTTQRLGKTTKRCSSLRLTISIFQEPVFATAVAVFGPWVAGIGENALDEGEETARTAIEDEWRAVAILHRGRMDDDVQQEAERIDEEVPLAARDLLARIKALRVERGAPFLSRFGALAVDDRRGRARLSAFALARRDVERVVDALLEQNGRRQSRIVLPRQKREAKAWHP